MFKHKKTAIFSAIIITSAFVSGCGLLGGEKPKIDPPNVSYLKDGQVNKDTKKKSSDQKPQATENKEASVKTELYLIDQNGYVVPQTLALPETKEVAKQALQFLVQKGEVEEFLPNGFKAVLPADTEASIDIKDKVATVNFSKEFAKYKKEDELKILQAVTWTLTQFETIDKVKLQLDGQALTKMPVNNTPINEPLTRKIGINIDTSDVVDITNTKPVTLYYVSENSKSSYFVPVTHRVSRSIEDNVEAVVNELIKGPGYDSTLVSGFFSDVKLMDKPKLEDGHVTLNFNQALISSLSKEKVISSQLLNELVLSLTELPDVQSVSVMVDGKSELVTDNGEKISKPVTRPQNVNTGSY